MRNVKKLIAVLLSSAVLAGCAATDVRSFIVDAAKSGAIQGTNITWMDIHEVVIGTNDVDSVACNVRSFVKESCPEGTNCVIPTHDLINQCSKRKSKLQVNRPLTDYIVRIDVTCFKDTYPTGRRFSSKNITSDGSKVLISCLPSRVENVDSYVGGGK